MSDVEDLEAELQAMEWEEVSLEPSPAEVEALDQQLPAEWLAELDQEQAFDREVIDPLTGMSEQELQQQLDIPEGDIDQNAQLALEELGLDVDALLHDIEDAEIELGTLETAEIEREQELDHDDDFGR